VDQGHEIAAKYHVQSMPTFLFIRNSQVVDQFSGASKEKLLQTIQKLK
jgi:thioredoxin 1